MLLVLQILCSFLFATGFLFTLIDLRTKYDRSFRYFGLSLIFLASLAAIDMWVFPRLGSDREHLFWQRVYHAVACLFIPYSLSYLYLITKRRGSQVPRYFLFATLAIMPFLFTDWMLTLRDGKVTPAVLYFALFFPYGVVYGAMTNIILIQGLKSAAANQRKILWFHLIGFALLSTGGVLDMLGVVNPATQLFPSYKFLGMIAYGLMASMIFTERFLHILQERQTTFDKLESAYRDMEQVNALKQLGESTAIINHEIRNYMFMIAGNAQLLQEAEHLSNKGNAIVKNILSSVERLTAFSDDILKLSRTQVLKERHPINVTELIKGLIARHYPEYQSRFTLVGMDREHFLFGDWGKLEQVFINLFNNSIEAGGGLSVNIKVKVTTERGLLMLSIEDNGLGCDKAQLDRLFQAFYTTKKASGGTGLGMSISRTIVESHGGKISAYSKNLARKGEHGMKLIMTFPTYEQNMAEEAGRKHPIVLIKEGMDNLPDLIRVFQNVKVSPYIVQDIEDLKDSEYPPDSLTILVSAKTMASRFKTLAAYPCLCMVSHHEKNLYILDHARGNRPELFSEEYVVSRLLRKSSQRVRLRERQFHLA
ncbi:MAG: HAMP domain-containing sensor histidine kinase [Fibrobacteria bacterium]